MASIPRRRHLLFLIPSLQGGGAERVIITLLQYLDRRQFRLSLAVLDLREAQYRNDVPLDVELIDLDSPRVRYALPKIIKLVWQNRPDVVFSTLGHLNLALAVLRPLLPNGVRYIARETCVVSELHTAYEVPFWWFWAYRQFYPQLDTVVCQSQDMRIDLIENFGFPPEKAIVINNPVDIERVRRLAEDESDAKPNFADAGIVYLVAAGRLTRQKGFDLAIEALALSGNLRLHLTILGRGPLLKDLGQMVMEKGLNGRVEFVGFRKNPYPYFARADAFVLSSRFEGFPNVVVEALACGTPVIATPSPGGVREILDGIEGCIVAESVSVGALAEAFAGFQGGYRLSADVVRSYGVTAIVGRYERELLVSNLP